MNLGSKTLTAGQAHLLSPSAATISGAGGSFIKAGTGTIVLSGTNTYTGGTAVSAGTLSVAGASSYGTGTLHWMPEPRFKQEERLALGTTFSRLARRGMEPSIQMAMR